MSSSPRYAPDWISSTSSGIQPGFSSAVLGANRNKGGLVLGQQELLTVDRHLTGAGENNPMLGAMVVHLHREGTARFHRDAVDVEARGLDHYVATAPGAVNLTVALVLAALVLLEELDRLLHVLGNARDSSPARRP